MKSFLYAGAVAIAAMSLSTAANATEMFGGNIALSGGPVSYTGIFGTQHTENFFDTWTFGPLPAGYASASAVNISFGTVDKITFTEGSLNGVALAFATTGLAGGGVLTTAYTLSQVFSAGGTNTLILKGTAGSTSSYSGTVNFTVSPVPEPATWAMMIAGLGIAGAALRRRASRVAVSFS